MKKIFIAFLVLIILALISVYGLLFTTPGNNLIASYIENKVNEGQDKVKLKVHNLKLTFNNIDFSASIDDNSNINISGILEIFKKRVDLKYDIKINELAYLENLIKQRFNGSFFTKGTFKGNKNFAVIQGISDLAKSDTKYKINLVNFEAKDINFNVKNAHIDSILNLLNKPIYARGKLNILGKIKNAKIGFLDGNITANIKKGKLLNKVINKHFKQNIQTNIYFNSLAKAKLSGSIVDVESDLITSMADIFLNQTIIDLRTNELKSDYKIDFKNLSKLQGIVGSKLNGNFITNGNIEVKNGIIDIQGKSNLLNSKTEYTTKIIDSDLNQLNFSINDAKLDSFFHMIDNPVYAVGKLDIKGQIRNRDKNDFYGTINTNIKEGKLINEVINNLFKKNLKDKVTFTTSIDTNLENDKAISNIIFKSSLAKLLTHKTIFDISKSTLSSDYLLNVPSLRKLEGLTSVKMRGVLDLNGTILSKSKSLSVDGNSKFLGGDLFFKLKNNNFNATLKDMQIKELTYMLFYPKVFDSKTSLNIDYNLLLKRGKLSATLLNGHFLPNNFSNILNQFSKFDITREVYEQTKISSDINDMILKSDVNMKSKNTSININNSILDLNKQEIDAKVDIKIRKTDFAIKVMGKTNKPKISLDTRKIIKKELNKQIEKNQDKIEEKLNKVLDGKLDDGAAKDIINNIKSLF